MLYTIASDLPGRLRLHTGARLFTEDEARGVSVALMDVAGVSYAEVHHRNGSILIEYAPTAREDVLRAVARLDVLDLPQMDDSNMDVPVRLQIALENNRFALEASNLVFWRLVRRFLLPTPLANAYTVFQAARFVIDGLKRLFAHELTVEVLDATAIAVSVARGNFADAATVMTLIRLTDIMDEHVQRRVHLALGECLVTRPETVWARVDGVDVEIGLDEVEAGQVLHLARGSVLPVDGTVVEGEGEIDESSMTGESRLVHKAEGSTVYAGTALEDGDLYVSVVAPPGKARIDDIVSMVAQSSGLKANAQSKAEHLADALVPYSFAAFFAILAITRNLTKAMAVLMVDYSCAIRLSTPICVMSAMGEATKLGMVVKGGKYMEALAAADTVVFDKTGTLTHACPTLEKVIPFSDLDECEVLRYAACIEEHFPHSMARAIVEGARSRGIEHASELHAEVEYVVAHGIKTHVGDQEAYIGSSHFVFEDEGIPRPDDLLERIEREAPTASVVYMAMGGRLVGALCIADPLRPEARHALFNLRELGIKHIVMLTGDSEQCARAVAYDLGIDEYHSQVLPEDKSGYVNTLRAQGHTVVMVGDGVNDSPALAAADVSVAMADASDIARAVADISILDSSLDSLVTVRDLSMRLMRRIRGDYRFIVGFNSALIVSGVAGLISITTAAYLHNFSTLAISALNTRSYLPAGRSGASDGRLHA